MSTAGKAYREVVEGGGRVVGIAPSVKERKWACLEGGKSDGVMRCKQEDQSDIEGVRSNASKGNGIALNVDMRIECEARKGGQESVLRQIAEVQWYWR